MGGSTGGAVGEGNAGVREAGTEVKGKTVAEEGLKVVEKGVVKEAGKAMGKGVAKGVGDGKASSVLTSEGEFILPQSGITFTNGKYCPNVTFASKGGHESLRRLASTGASWVSIIVTQVKGKRGGKGEEGERMGRGWEEEKKRRRRGGRDGSEGRGCCLTSFLGRVLYEASCVLVVIYKTYCTYTHPSTPPSTAPPTYSAHLPPTSVSTSPSVLLSTTLPFHRPFAVPDAAQLDTHSCLPAPRPRGQRSWYRGVLPVHHRQ